MGVDKKLSAQSQTDVPSVPLPALKSSAPPNPWVGQWQKPIFLFFILLFLVLESLLFLDISTTGPWRWVEGAFLVTAALSSLISLAHRLPLQNALMAGVLIYFFSTIILLIATVTHVPFGPFIYSEAMGGTLFGILPWSVPVIWMVFIITGRGIARLIMRPWRKTNYYGYWVIGLTCLLVTLLDVAMEPFAVLEKRYWLWQPTRTSLLWYTTPWVNFLGWFMTSFSIVCLTLPWLINKQPVKRSMDYHPLLCWGLLNIWFFTGNFLNQHWLACAVGLITMGVTTVMAVRGARW